RADKQGDDERRPMAREDDVVERDPDDHHDGGEDGRDHEGVQQQATEERTGGQRSAAQPFEDPVVAADRQRHGQVGVRRADHAEADDPRHVVLVVVEAQEVDGVAGVERGEDHQEHHREGEGEEGGRRVAPVALLLVLELMNGEGECAHAGSSSDPVSSRYTSSRLGRSTVSCSSGTRLSSAHPVSSWSTRTSSWVRTSTWPLPRTAGTGRRSAPTPSGSTKRIRTAASARPPIVSGVPSATMRPWAMTATRSARCWA